MSQLSSFEDVRMYLDRCVNHWRDRLDEANEEYTPFLNRIRASLE